MCPPLIELCSDEIDSHGGARPVKRVVQQELETALAKAILRGELAEVGAVCVAVAVNGVAPAAAAGATTAAAAS